MRAAEGRRVRAKGSDAIFLVMDGQLCEIKNLDAYARMWGKVDLSAIAEDDAIFERLPRGPEITDMNLFRVNGETGQYFVVNGIARGLPSMYSLVRLEFKARPEIVPQWPQGITDGPTAIP